MANVSGYHEGTIIKRLPISLKGSGRNMHIFREFVQVFYKYTEINNFDSSVSL